MKQPFYTKEIWCSRKRDNSPSSEVYRIYGKAYIPAAEAAQSAEAAEAAGVSEGRYPLLIFSHELGKNHEAGTPYAERLAAAGYAVYTFDYCGGTVFYGREGEIVRQRHSSGETTDASLVTWVDDLSAVLSAAAAWDFVDPERIYLMGGSQGAVSSVLAACRSRRDATAGLILLYPPLDLPERMHQMFHDRESIPETFDLFDGWIQLGRRYAEDIWDLDVYREFTGYSGQVLILHGDQDDVVDISVSEKAAAMKPDCRFCRIPGGRHGFKGEAFEEACRRVLSYLREGAC
ncbi:MAG: alpha/beta hydrolase [Eubacterium sp.]|nr:alpha/beta hydrolase [Eubacterium sp.]